LGQRVRERRAELGMAMFLIAEAVFFFLLILACAYFHALPRLYAPSGWILSALLLAGSLSIWRGWRWGAVALGAVFLVVLTWTPFAMLTRVLGLFVLAGVIALAVAPSGLRALRLYWYFFTAVWLVIFGVAGQA
jgi:heme/copper-type cytochrome/quinol oxidase subunit 3